MADAVEFYRVRNVQNVFVVYGWGCDCPDAELYEDKRMPLSAFDSFVADAQSADYYRVGHDNLHFQEENGRSEFLFCHESDVHFTSEDASLVNAVQRGWRQRGFSRVATAG